MTTNDLDHVLRQTLDDFRLSRGEKRALDAALKEIGADEQQLALLRSRAFAMAREATLGPESHAVIEWLEDIIKVLQPKSAATPTQSEAHFSPGNDCPRRICMLLDSTRRTADVCVFTITDDRISNAILAAHRRGVAMRVISDNDKSSDLGSDVEELARRGVPVRVDRTEYHMHHKFALFDGTRVLTGSYNWTRGADRYNHENLIVTDDPRLAKAFATEFDRLWETLR